MSASTVSLPGLPARPIAAVLAGGQSRRFGPSKVTADLAGRPMVAHVIAAATRAGLEVVLVGGPRSVAQALGVPWLADAPGIVGPVAGLVSALEYARSRHSSGVVLLGSDLPLFPAELVEVLTAEAGRRPGEALACRSAQGRLQTLGAYYPVAGLELVAGVAASPGPSLHHVLAALPGRTLHADAAVLAGLDIERAFLNVNTPADLERADRHLT